MRSLLKNKPSPLYFLALLGLIGVNACNNETSITIKLMTYNIRHGMGLDSLLDLSRVAEVIKTQSPDLCGLQEIDQFCARTDRVDQAGFLGAHTSMTETFGKFMDYDGGAYGMATLSTFSFISLKVLKLPDARYEPRSSIVHEVQVAEDCIIAFANVHFEWLSGDEGSTNRMKQARALVSYLDSLNRPAIVVGDFNCTPDSPTMQFFKEEGFVFVEKGDDNLTFQLGNKVEIDHIVYRNSTEVKFKVRSIDVLEEPVVSDHRPLVAELIIFY